MPVLILTVPAPWAWGLALGLRTWWRHHEPVPEGLIYPVPVYLEQGSQDKAFRGAVRALDKLALARGLEVMAKLVPWSRFASPGLVGQAELVRVVEHGTGQYRSWDWHLANPRVIDDPSAASAGQPCPSPRGGAALLGLFAERP
ncbi:MAG: hypothetical protein V1806_04910 [Pseudomonadota bacterium]